MIKKRFSLWIVQIRVVRPSLTSAPPREMSTTADDVTSKGAEDSPLCDESGQVPLVVYSPVTSDLLSPIPSTPEPSLAPSRDAQLRWLQRCLPIIAQPTHDITHGHGLCAVFVSFEGSECRMSHIYEVCDFQPLIEPTAQWC